MDLFELAVANKLAGGGGGGGDIDVDALNVTENGVYSASSGHAFDPVTVSVPQGVFPSGTSSITANGIYDITSFASVDVNVSGGGGHEDEDGLVTRNISEYNNNRVTSIGMYAFYFCDALSTANFPNVTSIGSGAFGGCSNLKSVNIPNATYIGNTAFRSCPLSTVSFPSATNIGDSAFANCASLTTANFPNVTSIGISVFYSCTDLMSANIPNVLTIGSGVFANCSALTTASFPNVMSIGSHAFRNCTSLVSAYFLSSSVVTLASTSVFQYTPMSTSSYTGSFGSIYVPASLVDSYKTAKNWSVYADRITSYVE